MRACVNSRVWTRYVRKVERSQKTERENDARTRTESHSAFQAPLEHLPEAGAYVRILSRILWQPSQELPSR